MTRKSLSSGSANRSVSEFLDKLASVPAVKVSDLPARLVFAIDATASRGPTWERACRIQGQMFESASALGGIEIQLCYYQGADLFYAGSWCASTDHLRREMAAAYCEAGYTQIGRVLRHAEAEAGSRRVNAVVFVGDCMEEHEDELAAAAGRLGIRNVPVFMFQEGNDTVAARTFRKIADLSGGAYCHFDGSSADQLKSLLGAVAAYAAGGRKALEDYGRKQQGRQVLLLIDQMTRR